MNWESGHCSSLALERCDARNIVLVLEIATPLIQSREGEHGHDTQVDLRGLRRD